ncbi:MAG: SpoIID/LytB domain-containing protein [Deltaproteobacteria bacterium]|nr:SpoIID/LytB domain-containing protein [Deltaproteobacteria bacterium]
MVPTAWRPFLIFLPLLVLGPWSSVRGPNIPSIRVALLKNVPAVTLQGKELRIRLPEEKPVSYYLDSPVRVSAAAEGIQVGDQKYAYPQVRIQSLEKPIAIGSRQFEGTLEFHKTGDDSLLVLNDLSLETYLTGLVHGEIHASWPAEVIKAQVVAARTYALFRQEKRKQNKNSLYDLEGDQDDQVYVGSKGSADISVQKAIEQTHGEVLWFLGLYPAYFHSCCGGMTEKAEKAWGKKETSAQVADPFCKRSPFSEWELKLSTGDFLKKLRGHGLEGRHLKNISLERHDGSPRNAVAVIETDKMNLYIGATDLRRIVGYGKLKSTWFEVQHSPHSVSFRGLGYGHGVGLCQWGAKAMAEAGKSYQEILKFYYPKAVVRKLY